METWFWILGWVLSFLTILGNGFTIFLVCSRRNLRTKTNAFIVSLAVADFCVGLSVIPSLFACDVTNTCYWPQHLGSWVNFIRWLFHPLKYITLMTRRRIIQVIFFSWVLTVSYNALKDTLQLFYFKTIPVLFTCLTIVSKFLPCVVLILCFVSMIFHVCRHEQSARTLAKQLRFNHQMSFKIQHDRSAVIMMGLVIAVFLVCYGIHLCCSFLTLSSSRCNDETTKFLSWF
ncbi:unnamed protein product [Porites evermanni]|uniref:G-protein coupled receptors family 1 profile domain-containing protein n=1 Tax=Porites evermanni TaxID=104178 RepID=A0ABN8RHX3_9CNID|nr:unnamed protein product [Porites evermanni]